MKVQLSKIDPGDTGDATDKRGAMDEISALQKRMRKLHTQLYAERKQAVLVIVQGMDGSGKDGAVQSVFGGLNPHAARAWSFKEPTNAELAHDFLWRVHMRVPARGEVAVFNRSHYEDVVAARVRRLVPKAVWQPRFAAINAFERTLSDSGTAVLKLFLHISKDEQKRRFEARLGDAAKHWKFDARDLQERTRWDQYMAAYQEAIDRCSTPHAPWHVIPSDKKWSRNLMVSRAVVAALDAIDPGLPDRRDELAGIVID